MSSELVGYNEWLSLYATQTDIIRIKNIALSAFAGHDGWGRRKEQQVIISISVALTGSFYTASGSDVVDSSTIHYGNLGKNITTAVDEKTESKIWQDDIELAKLISNVAKETASNPSLLSSCVVTVYFPKGLVHGEGAGLRYCISFASDKYAACRYLKNVRLPLLLGVNDYERKKKQMVIANIWLDGTNKLLLDSSFAGLEERYVKVRIARFRSYNLALLTYRDYCEGCRGNVV